MTTPPLDPLAVARPEPDTSLPVAPPTDREEQGPIVAATWQDILPAGPWCPADVAEYVPGWIVDHAPEATATAQRPAGAPWRLVAASVRGRSHAHRGEFREDAFALETSEGLVVLCAADGAGSSRLSRVGAELTCRETARRIVAKLEGERAYLVERTHDELAQAVGHAIGLSVWETCRELHDIAARSGTSPNDYRCTVLIAVLYRSRIAELVVTSQVGDGAMVAWRTDGSIQRLGDADSGDYAGEVRCFVPDAKAPERASHVRVSSAATLAAIGLFTDGVDDVWYPIEQLAPAMMAQWRTGAPEAVPLVTQTFRGPVLEQHDEGARLAEWLGYERRGENDDRTAVLLYRAADRSS